MPSTVFLDLYGVLIDGRLMEPHYNERMASLLHERFGGDLAAWRRVQAESYEWYLAQGALLDRRDGAQREGDPWVQAVAELNANQMRYVLERMGHAMPEDLPRFAEALEEATVSSVDATFPDVKPALAALKEQGHRLFLSTNANRSNAESALFGGGIREFFDGLLMLETARAKKDRPYYWRRAFEHAATDPAQAVVVDDVPKFLAPPAMMGATCFHLVRSGESPGLSSFPVIGSLDSLCARIR